MRRVTALVGHLTAAPVHGGKGGAEVASIPTDPAWPDQCARAALPEVAAAKDSNTTIAELFAATMQRRGGASPCLVEAGTGRTLSFADVDALSNRVAHFALERGLRAKRDFVALMMNNSCEFIGLCKRLQQASIFDLLAFTAVTCVVMQGLGMAKVGVPVFFINPAQHGASLLHSLKLR